VRQQRVGRVDIDVQVATMPHTVRQRTGVGEGDIGGLHRVVLLFGFFTGSADKQLVFSMSWLCFS
jgi:hypothetical protein